MLATLGVVTAPLLAADPENEEQQQYALKLETKRVVRAGQSIRLTLKLKNVGVDAVAGCVHFPRHVRFTSGDQMVNSMYCGSIHDTCASGDEFQLKPGRKHRWTETVEVPDLPAGPIALRSSVTIVSTNGLGVPLEGTDVWVESAEVFLDLRSE